MVAYNCAKAGIEALNTHAGAGRKEIRGKSVVNAVAPGLVDTAFEHCRDETKESEALGQNVREIAETVLFLASQAPGGKLRVK